MASGWQRTMSSTRWSTFQAGSPSMPALTNWYPSAAKRRCRMSTQFALFWPRVMLSPAQTTSRLICGCRPVRRKAAMSGAPAGCRAEVTILPSARAWLDPTAHGSASSSLRWLADDRVAVRWIREDAGRRARCRLRELVHSPEVVGPDAVVDRSVVRREPRVDAVRAAVRRAVGGADKRVAKHLGLPAGIRYRGPVLLV